MVDGLNDPQREAVLHDEGPILVLAGAGSGKTRVITHRMARLVKEGVPPARICALTFTNKAAAEMRARVARLLPNSSLAADLSVGTFHSLGLRMVRAERAELGLPRGFTIYDSADQMGVLREILRDKMKDGRRFDVKSIHARISLAKNSFIAPGEFQPEEHDEYDVICQEVYPQYQEAMRAFGALDFDDLIVEPVRLMRENPQVERRWAEQFQYLLVDEYQDTNKTQLHLLKALCNGHENVCVVGDDVQSIYSWRGANSEQILDFEKDFSGAKVVVLDQNYRSTPSILQVANAVIENNKKRRGKKLWSDCAVGEPVVAVRCSDPDAESRFLVQQIQDLLEDGTTEHREIAVLYRSNLQTRNVEAAFREHDIPYVVYGGQQFFERKEVKDLLAYLRVGCNQSDEMSLRRVINYPARGIGAQTIARATAWRKAHRVSLWKALAVADGLPPRSVAAVEAFHKLIEELSSKLKEGDLVAAVRWLVDAIKLEADIRAASPSSSAARRRLDNIEGFISLLQRFAESKPDLKAFEDFLRKLSLDMGSDSAEENTRNRIVLTTLHGAKGLEFDNVFLIGMEEELLPHARTLMPKSNDILDPDHVADISEERRLAYVGMTRARKRLFLTRATHRSPRGRAVPRTPSRFLCEIPTEMLVSRDFAEEERRPVDPDSVSQLFALLAES